MKSQQIVTIFLLYVQIVVIFFKIDTILSFIKISLYTTNVSKTICDPVHLYTFWAFFDLFKPETVHLYAFWAFLICSNLKQSIYTLFGPYLICSNLKQSIYTLFWPFWFIQTWNSPFVRFLGHFWFIQTWRDGNLINLSEGFFCKLASKPII